MGGASAHTPARPRANYATAAGTGIRVGLSAPFFWLFGWPAPFCIAWIAGVIGRVVERRGGEEERGGRRQERNEVAVICNHSWWW